MTRKTAPADEDVVDAVVVVVVVSVADENTASEV